MSKMSNLDLVLDEMITTGQKMIDAATALKEMFSETAPEMSKIRDGEPLGGKSRTEDDFATEEDDDFLS